MEIPQKSKMWLLYDEIIAYVSECFREAAKNGDYANMFKAAEMILEYWRKKENYL